MERKFVSRDTAEKDLKKYTTPVDAYAHTEGGYSGRCQVEKVQIISEKTVEVTTKYLKKIGWCKTEFVNETESTKRFLCVADIPEREETYGASGFRDYNGNLVLIDSGNGNGCPKIVKVPAKKDGFWVNEDQVFMNLSLK